MEGFDRIRNACRADLKFNEGDLEVSVKSTVFPEIVMLPCRVNNAIKWLFYVLSFVGELNRRLSRLKLVWKASGLGLAYTFVRLSFVACLSKSKSVSPSVSCREKCTWSCV